MGDEETERRGDPMVRWGDGEMGAKEMEDIGFKQI